MHIFLVYIAGPMKGYPEHNYPAFIEAEKQLTSFGIKVLNPVNHSAGVGTDLPYSYYIRRSVEDVLHASAVCVLPGWEKSTGAKLEVHLAQALGLPIYRLQDMIEANGASIVPKIEVGPLQVMSRGQLVG